MQGPLGAALDLEVECEVSETTRGVESMIRFFVTDVDESGEVVVVATGTPDDLARLIDERQNSQQIWKAEPLWAERPGLLRLP